MTDTERMTQQQAVASWFIRRVVVALVLAVAAFLWWLL